ncbi:hypothetical protein ACGFNX_28785 [Streptomyces sp. NPDC048723]|uniref:hypothetical protein n=1 Tax=unclassified Streptomyces TaxID=2593676 RepID=UPI0035621663
MIQFIPSMIVSLGVHFLLNGKGERGGGWELAGTSDGESERELAAVERLGIFANSGGVRITVERTLSRQWTRSIAWDVKGAMEKAAKAKVPFAEAEVKASLELHAGVETTVQSTESQRFLFTIEPKSQVEILVHWYRQVRTGTVSLSNSATSGDSRPTLLTVPYREVKGLTAEVFSRDIELPR